MKIMPTKMGQRYHLLAAATVVIMCATCLVSLEGQLPKATSYVLVLLGCCGVVAVLMALAYGRTGGATQREQLLFRLLIGAVVVLTAVGTALMIVLRV